MTALYAAPLYVPKFRAFSANGAPLAGGKVNTYVAGTVSAPLATYPTYTDALAGTNANANPVILDANGEANIFLTPALYKIVLQDSSGVTQWTEDNVSSALANPYPVVSEWTAETNSISYSSPTGFNVLGVDVTAIYHVGRRVKTQNTGGIVYSTVIGSSFGTNTAVNLVNDSGNLDAGLSSVSYGMTSYVNQSYLGPRTATEVTKNGVQTGFAAATKVINWTAGIDAFSEWDAANNRINIKLPGNYQVFGQAEYLDTGTNVDVTLEVRKNTLAWTQARSRSSATASQIWSVSCHGIITASAGSIVEMYFTGSANTSIQGTAGTRLCVVRIP